VELKGEKILVAQVKSEYLDNPKSSVFIMSYPASEKLTIEGSIDGG